MTSMVDSHEVVDSSGCRRIELTGVKFALVRWNRRKGVAHIADTRLVKIHQVQPGDCRENFDGAVGYAGYAWMFMQCDPLIDRMDEVGAEQVDACGDIRHDMLKIECCVGSRPDYFGELDIARRTPGKPA